MLLRHAKSSWKDSDLADHESSAEQAGEKNRPANGAPSFDGRIGARPHLFVDRSSGPGDRRGSGEVFVVRGTDRALDTLYLAPPGKLLGEAQSRTPDSVDRLLLVAHNPGMEDLVEILSGARHAFPTAALAVFEVGIERWEALELGVGTKLSKLHRPKEIGLARYSFSFSSRSSAAMSMKSRSVTMPMSRPSFTTGRDPMRRSFMRRIAA